MPSVFLSHSSKNKLFLREPYRRLTRDGVTCFLDEKSIDRGNDFVLNKRLQFRELSMIYEAFLRLSLVFLLGTLLSVTPGPIWAEAGMLVVHVKDAQGRPVAGIQVGVEGDGGTGITAEDGKVRLPLAKQTKEKSWISLQIVKSPPGKDYVLVSPWDYRVTVPSFENESENFVEVVVVQRGDRVALENGTVLAALVARINSANVPKAGDDGAVQKPEANLASVAAQYGLTPSELDQAIREWGANTVNLEEAGQAALYERNYPNASEAFTRSLRDREKRLATDQKAVADNAFFLGVALYGEGKYRESVNAYQRCLQLRPDDNVVIGAIALSLHQAGEYAAAELLYRQVLAAYENSLKPDDPRTEMTLNDLAVLLREEGHYQESEKLYKRALAIEENAVGPKDVGVARVLDNLAVLLQDEGDYFQAEQLFRRSLAISEKTLGPDDIDVAVVLDNLAVLLGSESRNQEADELSRRALAIYENKLGPNHPGVAKSLTNRAAILDRERDYEGAERLDRRALAIDEKALGPEHPDVATVLNNLGEAETDEGKYVEAEQLLRRALAINEKILGPDHIHTADSLNDLALVLKNEGEYEDAEKLYRRALTIEEKAAGPENISVAVGLSNLGILLWVRGNYGDAAPLLQRALAIDEKVLGTANPRVAADLDNLAILLRDTGDYRQAGALLRRALAIDEKILGPNDPRSQEIRDDLASLEGGKH